MTMQYNMLIQKTVVFLLEDLSVSTALLIRTTVTLFGVVSCIDSLFYSTVCLLTVEVPIVTNINFLLTRMRIDKNDHHNGNANTFCKEI